METTIKIDSNNTAILTTCHPSSSHGQPVLIFGGEAYGQKDKLPLGEIAEMLGDNDAKSVVETFWKANTFECSKMPVEEYNLIAKFIGQDLAQ